MAVAVVERFKKESMYELKNTRSPKTTAKLI